MAGSKENRKRKADGISKTGKAKKEKAAKPKKEKKDPNKPKGALSAYMFYTKHNRKRISEENEGIKFGEVGKKCGEEWAALDAMGKKKYEDMNAEDKKRHTKEMEAYNNDKDENENIEGL
jgi:structure-specific recognition protein 1